MKKQNISGFMLRYKCTTCGNTCLQNTKPDNSVCGGCNRPNWKLLKNQEAYNINQKDYIHVCGEI